MNNIKIKNDLKNFKHYEIKNILKCEQLVLFFHSTNLNKINYLKIKQKFYKNSLICKKIHNNITKLSFKRSILKHFDVFVHGSLCLIYPKKGYDFNLKHITKLDKSMSVLGLKLNQRIYSQNQFNSISTLNYNNNIKILTKILKQSIKLPYYKFKTSNCISK